MRARAYRRHPVKLLLPYHLRVGNDAGMGDDRYIERAGRDAVDQQRRRLAQHAHFRARIGARKPRQNFRQKTVGIIVRYAKPHMPREIGVGQRRHRLRRQPHDPPRIFEQPLAFLGQLRLPSVAREDRLSDPLLQPLHLHGYGRLRLVHDIGGLRERAGIGNGHKGLQLIDIQKRAHGLRLHHHQ
jgi:hypothetical protein